MDEIIDTVTVEIAACSFCPFEEQDLRARKGVCTLARTLYKKTLSCTIETDQGPPHRCPLREGEKLVQFRLTESAFAGWDVETERLVEI